MAHPAVCGWSGSLTDFSTTIEPDWMGALVSHSNAISLPPSPSQIAAWRNCFKVMQESVSRLLVEHRPSESWTLVFEFVLPRERGRRPDVVILAGNRIFVLEFKDHASVQQAHIDQASAYARDLENYHSASHNRKVIAAVVLTGSAAPARKLDGVRVFASNDVSEFLRRLAPEPNCTDTIAPAAWLNADYLPLPSLVAAARTIFNHEPLPSIRRAASAGIPETIAALLTIAEQARTTNTNHLALVTGVPGAGKTLVGLQLVYASHLDKGDGARSAVFLSGNGPLVKVLQHALKNSVFVQDVHGFLVQYGGTKTQPPEEHIWVYDEAQRAWDSERVKERRNHTTSEPEDFLRIGERKKSWAVMVGLIGEGQEIHLGEESGLPQWNVAMSNMTSEWSVHCPEKIAHLFTAATHRHANERLDLTCSLRTHIAEDVQIWISQLLNGEIMSAAQSSSNILKQGFALYCTQNLEQGKEYATTRYAESTDKTFGLLASSKATNVEAYGIRNSFNYTRNLREGPWYNDPQDSPSSSCSFRDVATEFACQGLELDLPIVAWGNDLKWSGTQWSSPPQRNSKAHDPHQLRLNSYRVLLSRGRDGVIIFVPPTNEMQSTWSALLSAGVRPLART